MKKTLVLLLAAMLILSSCSGKPAPGPSSQPAPLESQTDQASTKETSPETQPTQSESLMEIVDKEGSHIGAIDARAVCSTADAGIFYSVFAPAEYQFTAPAEYHFFNKDTQKDTLLGTLDDQGYEATYSRLELGGRIYTLAVSGNPQDEAPDPLLLLSFDPVAGTMKRCTVSEYGFPYASMAAVDGKLLIMNHEMSNPKTDIVYEFDPEPEKIRTLLSFPEGRDSLRGVSAAEDGFYLLRLQVENDIVTEMILDRYDRECKKLSEQPLYDTVMRAVLEIPGIADDQDALIEPGMMVSSFRVIDDRYMIYENFGRVRMILDLQTEKPLLAKNDLYAFSLSNETPVLFRMDFDPDTAAVPEIVLFRNSSLKEVPFQTPNSHKMLRKVSVSPSGTWLAETSDSPYLYNETRKLILWTEPITDDSGVLVPSSSLDDIV